MFNFYKLIFCFKNLTLIKVILDLKLSNQTSHIPQFAVKVLRLNAKQSSIGVSESVSVCNVDWFVYVFEFHEGCKVQAYLHCYLPNEELGHYHPLIGGGGG